MLDPIPSLHVDLDGAWPRDLLGPDTCLDCRAWGPALRYSARGKEMRAFTEFTASRPARFTLFGSGDFHHLALIWLTRLREPYTLLSFDNHPDWDIRPPRWCCGTWMSRALESPLLEHAAIWGCGNFELERPMSFFANHRGLRSGRLQARPWAERLKPATRARWPIITRENWRAEFAGFAASLKGRRIYITVDFDSLDAQHSATNWENGLFTAEDIAWAVGEVRQHAEVVGGDLCGAYSVPELARIGQRMVSLLDHPKLPPVDSKEARERNLRSWQTIWPALTGARDAAKLVV